MDVLVKIHHLIVSTVLSYQNHQETHTGYLYHDNKIFFHNSVRQGYYYELYENNNWIDYCLSYINSVVTI